jgi:hypothetical protein
VTRNSTIHPVSIGSGLFVRTRRPEGIFAYYCWLQRTCIHEKRDPQGTCYRCGHRMPIEVPEPECDSPCHCTLNGPGSEIALQE